MSKPTGKMLHFEGTFTGYYSAGSSISNMGVYEFKKIEWEFLDIKIERKLPGRKFSEEKVLDYWFCEHLYAPRKFNPFAQPQCEIILRLPAPFSGKYNADLFDVVLSEYTGRRLKDHFPLRSIYPGKAIAPGAFETSGKIRFSVPDPTPAQTVITSSQNTTPNITISGPSEEISTGYLDGGYAEPTNNKPSTIFILPPKPLPPTVPTKGCFGSSLLGLIGLALLFYQPWVGIIFIALLLSRSSFGNEGSLSGRSGISFWSILLFAVAGWWLYTMWGNNQVGFYILSFASLLHLFSLFGNSGFWRILSGLILGLTMVGLSFLLLNNIKTIAPEPEKKRASVKVREKKPLPSPTPFKQDSLYEHYMSWTDFEPRTYEGNYPTTLADYQQSIGFHKSVNQLGNPQTEDEYWRFIYTSLARNDQPKMDSLIEIFKTKIHENNLNANQTAEMVVSYIQQIPYVLVHDQTCAQAVAEGNDFMRTYHFEGKPCIAEIPAGVQSPYEFAHNLDGDCDTRSLFAFSLLSALKIPCSIWISSVYGHSIIGIGLPAGGGNFKYVNGERHFGTELTNTGFMLGMMAPSQTDMDNWKIALETNF